MQERINTVFFDHPTDGADKETQAQIRRIIQNEMMMEEGNRRRREKEMERRITENVMKNIEIKLESDLIKQLRDTLNGLNN